MWNERTDGKMKRPIRKSQTYGLRGGGRLVMTLLSPNLGPGRSEEWVVKERTVRIREVSRILNREIYGF